MPDVNDPARRALFVDERGTGMRASWHADRSQMVISLWREDVCVATCALAPGEALRLAEFVVAHVEGALRREAG